MSDLSVQGMETSKRVLREGHTSMLMHLEMYFSSLSTTLAEWEAELADSFNLKSVAGIN